MEKNVRDVIDVDFNEKEITEKETKDVVRFIQKLDISEMILEFVLRTVLFIAVFLFIGVFWMILEIKLYGEVFPSIVDTFIGAVVALYVSQKLFNRFCIEIVEEIEYEEE